MTPPCHQYIDRTSREIRTEPLFFDRTIQFLYSTVRENAPFMFSRMTSGRASAVLGFFYYDFFLTNRRINPVQVLRRLGADPGELADSIADLDTFRKIFERRIRYPDTRPMDDDRSSVVSPADSRVLTGTFDHTPVLFIKEKFFNFDALLGLDKKQWRTAFNNGPYAVFRLTPDKYHYNHAPVSGIVRDIYEIDGTFHSCNPGAVVRTVTPYSLNRRVVTIIDTDVENGTRAGMVAMIEIVALMIGKIVQCYSDRGYADPQDIRSGVFIKKGQPKSLFRPGSSTTVLIFQKNRVRFSRDLIDNQCRTDVHSRFTRGFQTPLVETDIRVRDTIATAV